MTISSSPYETHEGIFLWSSPWNTVRLLALKGMRAWGTPAPVRLDLQLFLSVRLFQPQQFISYSLGIPTSSAPLGGSAPAENGGSLQLPVFPVWEL